MAAPDVESQLDATSTGINLTSSPPTSGVPDNAKYQYGPTRPATPPRSPGHNQERDAYIQSKDIITTDQQPSPQKEPFLDGDGPSTSVIVDSKNPLNEANVDTVISKSPYVGQISVRTVSAAIDYHYSNKVPDLESVFPWAHGLHEQNLHQRAFLDPMRRFRDDTGLFFDDPAANCKLLALDPIFAPPADVHGLMVVKVGDELNEYGSLVGSVTPQEILQLKDGQDGSEISEDDEAGVFSSSPGINLAHTLVESAPVDDAIDAALHPVDLMHKPAAETRNESNNSTPAPSPSNTNTTFTNDPSIQVISDAASVPTPRSASPIPFSSNPPSTAGGHSHLRPHLHAQAQCQFLPEFLCLDPPKGISLRNFQVQVAKWATVSSFIVYAPNPQDHATAVATAKVLAQAQVNFAKKYTRDTTCRTYICLASIDSFYAVSPHVVAVPPKEQIYDFDEVRLKNWDSNFLFHERVEMSMMSAASMVGDGNVWLGNTVDFEVYIDMLVRPKNANQQDGVQEKAAEFSSSNFQDGPFVSSPPLEAQIQAKAHSEAYSQVHTAQQQQQNQAKNHGHSHTACLTPSEVAATRNWATFVECFEGPQLPVLSVLDQYIKEAVECSLVPEQQDKCITPLSIQFPSSGSIPLSELSEDLAMTFVSLCKLLYIRSKVQYKGRTAGVLIYCNDGYTETSLLALAYIVYSTGVPSSQAWLDLHTKYGRPFFCFNIDVLFMLALERVLLEYSPAVAGSKFEQDVGCVAPTSAIRNSLTISNNVPEWFGKLDGSLPSKILPHLYLGSLAHANNPELLTRLGIRRILSVGEVLNWMPYRMEAGGKEGKEAVMQQGIYERPYSGITKVMYIDNILDDGVDALTESLAACLKFIDEGYKANEATLVHCRVGVSRSATVCIAEVMKRLSVGLPRAYLFVRVRRLNVIIQPNLRFMYELVKWEERNRRSGEGWLREVDWPIFCREIALINKVYIS